jgi:hypothetical protein
MKLRWEEQDRIEAKFLTKTFSLGMIRNKIPVSFLFRGMTQNGIASDVGFAKQAEFRRNSSLFRLVSSFEK